MKKSFVILSLVTLFVPYVFGISVNPFSLSGNSIFLSEDGTSLMKFGLVADIGFNQNFFTLNNLNAFLNEEEIEISPEKMSNAINNGLKMRVPVSMVAYFNSNIFGFRFVPYVELSGSLGLDLPKTVSKILFDNISIDETYSDSVKNFLKADLKLSAGINVMFGNFLFGISLFSPVGYSDPENTQIYAEYTSSTSPALAKVQITGGAKLFGNFDISQLDEVLSDPDKVVNALTQLGGINLSFGYGTPNIGVVLKDLTIMPAKAKYANEFSFNVEVFYKGEGTNLEATTTSNFVQPIFSQLLVEKEIYDNAKLSFYWKNDGFFTWGITTGFSFAGDFEFKGFAGIDLAIVKPYYVFGYNSGFVSHSFGLGIDLFLVNADVVFSTSSTDFIPLPSSTPGYSVILRVAAGF